MSFFLKKMLHLNENKQPDHLFLHYGWFLQNLGKDFIRTNMHTTVLCSFFSPNLGISDEIGEIAPLMIYAHTLCRLLDSGGEQLGRRRRSESGILLGEDLSREEGLFSLVFPITQPVCSSRAEELSLCLIIMLGSQCMGRCIHMVNLEFPINVQA